eukprot:CAMPEP_0119005324 /NCGR_PEP_ID=MMETSP1176-20130426/1652_1 /TAXON_ID=265551 /ORGANISM="Synedropsis recta cf, Strain CCMP1620" /LENGTH=185 /DNA_ID=CAMNT_0006957113 /DNA_START=19 /DNA_END=576 /DNA_ORIENTATION=+
MMASKFLVALALLVSSAHADFKIPFLSKKQYTPLIFFKLPGGASPHSDAMEKAVREVEKELGVRVERMDVARDMAAERLYSLLAETLPPLLYNRESKQMVQMKINPDEETPNVRVDKDRVRAWAKGRRVAPLTSVDGGGAPLMFTTEEAGIEQDELMMDMGMTPNQIKGKEAIKERTEERAKSRK